VPEDDERRLKGIVGVRRVAEDAAACGTHRRSVPAKEFGERLLVPLDRDPAQQVGIGRAGLRQRPEGRPADILAQSLNGGVCHRPNPSCVRR